MPLTWIKRHCMRAIRAFIGAERRHMEMEEQKPFPAVISAMKPADWTKFGVSLAWRADPSADPGAEDRFAVLRQSLRRWESETRR
jgi:hypothetical protein